MRTPLDRRSATPVWQQLLDDLLARVKGGDFTDAFPSELVLQKEYGVSRQTVRQALRKLREDGVVTAARGRVARLATPTEIEQPIGALYSLFSSVHAAGIEQRSIVRVLDIRADGVIADRLGLEGAAPLLFLERLRLAGPEPLAVDRVWLPAEFAAPLLAADFTDTGLYAELTKRCGVRLTGGQEHLQAVVPTSHERDLLQIDADTGAFAIDRLGLARGRPVEWRHTVIRGDRFSLTAQFTARTGYPLNVRTTHRSTKTRSAT
jgi:GntR family transcriptional regulator